MNKLRFIILNTCCLLAPTTQAQKIEIQTGVDRLKKRHVKYPKGKCVGLITNPLDGKKFKGTPTEEKYISFVSQFKIPYLYGLTCGESTLTPNNRNMLSKQCKLHMVKMINKR